VTKIPTKKIYDYHEFSFFFVFAGLALVGSLFVIFSANPVHSVLSLILVFCSTSMLLFATAC
jgi:NADH:ubiquinone oxidoreductase subunit 6 (subunit J)